MNALDPIPVYVPVVAGLKAVIDAGAAIVGSESEAWLRQRAERIREVDPDKEYAATQAHRDAAASPDDTLIIDYEGNRYGAVNMVTFADRCLHAHGRHVEHYPTVARAMVPAANVEWVALYYPDHRRVEVTDGRGLAQLTEWLGNPSAGAFARQLQGSGR